MKPIIKIENVSKQYRLGTIGTGTLSNDLKRWTYRLIGREDPFLKIGETNDRSQKGTSKYVWALQDINLEIQPGEVVGIIGKNGAGKSTLLKILSKVTGPTTGSIHYDGRIGSLLEVGTGFHPELTGRENIFLNGAILGMTKQEIRSKLDEIIDFSGCERYVDTPVKRYSSGMMVRLGFAVAAHLEPEILVVDEVLAVGDAEFQKKAIGKMQDVANNDGRTVLFVSHNMASIQALCDKGVMMQNGKVKMVGPVGEVVQSYLADNQSNIRTLYSCLSKSHSGKDFEITEAFFMVNNKRVDKVLIGQDVDLIIDYRAEKPDMHLNVQIGIYNSLEEKVVLLNDLYSDDSRLFTNKEGKIKCSIHRLPLAEGVYSINLFVQANGITCEHIKDAMKLVVESGDFYNNGKVPKLNEAKFLVKQSWKSL